MIIGPLRTAFLTDLATTAISGGIDHWAGLILDPSGGMPEELRVTVEETRDLTRHLVTVPKMHAALNKIISGTAGIHARHRLALTLAANANDAAGIDAGLADVVLQIAVLGKVSYPVHGFYP